MHQQTHKSDWLLLLAIISLFSFSHSWLRFYSYLISYQKSFLLFTDFSNLLNLIICLSKKSFKTAQIFLTSLHFIIWSFHLLKNHYNLTVQSNKENIQSAQTHFCHSELLKKSVTEHSTGSSKFDLEFKVNMKFSMN